MEGGGLPHAAGVYRELKNLTSSAARRTVSGLEGGLLTRHNAYFGDLDADGGSAGKKISSCTVTLHRVSSGCRRLQDPAVIKLRLLASC